MKRRDFLARSVALASGAALPGLAKGSTPCPPPMVSSGSSVARTPCGSDAEADWVSRISGPGVVWYHDFRSDAEVDQFRWIGGIGNDPNDVGAPGRCIRNTSEGITGGGCLELIHPVGTGGAPGWWRPFAPLRAGANGRSEDDPAASGSLTLHSWNARGSASTNENFRQGYYANPAYIGADGFSRSQFNGSEFWLQFRIKISGSRYREGTPRQGKLLFVATTQQTLNQEIVAQNERNRAALWYTNFGSSPDTGGSMGSGSQLQPGGEFTGCGSQGGVNGCWLYRDDEWVTWLYHVVCGTHGVKNTLFEAFVARQGETKYTTVFSASNTIKFSPTSYGHPMGWNAFHASNYMNNQPSSERWSQFYDQIIFSHEFIPCPKV